ncbi:hydrolase, partial [Vibrio parahaemolyticus]
MSKVYLFDWGDTLMNDFPDQTGKMCDWENIQAVNGALQT